MHWPYPPNPAEYQSPRLGLVIGMFVIALIFVVVVFYATQSNATLFHKPELDEAGSEERESNKIAE
ncbi:MAG TPA: hypothetical protein VGK36_08550 [Candidatus Angelobacter sp.]|jgi:cytochrome c-type biogenesis protein CcmE